MYSYSQKSKRFGTSITLPGPADLNQAVIGLCWPQLYAVLGSSGVKLSDTHSNSYCTVLSDEMIMNNDMEAYEGKWSWPNARCCSGSCLKILGEFENSHSGFLVSWARYDLSSSRIEVRSTIVWVNLPGISYKCKSKMCGNITHKTEV